MAKPEDVERASVLMATNDRKTKNCAGTTLAVVGFAVTYGPVGEAEDGEIVEGVRGHILLDDGTSVFTTSQSILQALKIGLKVYGSGKLWEPQLLEIKEVKAKRGDALIGIWRGKKNSPVKKK